MKRENWIFECFKKCIRKMPKKARSCGKILKVMDREMEVNYLYRDKAGIPEWVITLTGEWPGGANSSVRIDTAEHKVEIPMAAAGQETAMQMCVCAGHILGGTFRLFRI